MKFHKPKITSAHALALVALFVALGGTAYAATAINGRSIRVGSIPGNRLRADAVSGQQVQEGSLGTVPSATSAQTAETAKNAERAGLATKATEATHAASADSATNAQNAALLGGLGRNSFQGKCAEGTIKGIARVNENNGTPVLVNFFSCSGQPPTVEAVRNPNTNQPTSEYRVDFVGLDNLQSALVSDIKGQADVDVEGEFAGRFKVSTDRPNGEDVNDDQFTIVVF